VVELCACDWCVCGVCACVCVEDCVCAMHRVIAAAGAMKRLKDPNVRAENMLERAVREGLGAHVV